MFLCVLRRVYWSNDNEESNDTNDKREKKMLYDSVSSIYEIPYLYERFTRWLDLGFSSIEIQFYVAELIPVNGTYRRR